MKRKVYTVTIRTIVITDADNMPPDCWPTKELIELIADADVDVDAKQWTEPEQVIEYRDRTDMTDQEHEDIRREFYQDLTDDSLGQQELIPGTTPGAAKLGRPKRDRKWSETVVGRYLNGESGIGQEEYLYRSEGYTRLARELDLGTPQSVNGSMPNGVWLTLGERAKINAEHRSRYATKRSEGVA